MHDLRGRAAVRGRGAAAAGRGLPGAHGLELFYGGKLEGESEAPPAGPAADWMVKAGLAGLVGPGGWAQHGQPAAPSHAQPDAMPTDTTPVQPEAPKSEGATSP